VRAGSRLLVVAATGRGAAPNVTLRGPGRTVVTTPPLGVFTTVERGQIAFRNTDDSTTYFAIGRPARGRWTLTAEGDSAPVTSVRRAGARRRLKVRARVTGRGRARRLRFTVGRQRGLRVVFYERALGGLTRITATRGGHGSKRFLPATGRGRRRQVVAVAMQDGLPRDRITVARFAARTPRPGRPRRARIRRRGAAVVVRFKRASGAVRHAVMVRVSDGRRLLYLPRRRHRVLVGGVPRRMRVSVSVRGLDAAGRSGPARQARLPRR